MGRTWEYNMVAQTTLVVFTIVLAATGVFVPEAGRELEENDALISVQNEADIQESGHFVKRDAGRDETSGGGKGKRKKSKKSKATRGKKRKSKNGQKSKSKSKKGVKRTRKSKKRIKEGKVGSKKKKGKRNNAKKSRKR